MARASTRTLLPLDTYARLMGINPVFFNGGGPIQLTGSIIFPTENANNTIWPQYSWQNHDQVSREELAAEIARAEHDVMEFLHFSPAPDWVEDEIYDFPLHYATEVGQNYIDVTGNDAGVPLRMKKFIATGRRKSTFLNTYGVVYTDPDGDGWSELATITVPLTTNTDLYSYKVYFAGYSDDTWEIRPARSKTIVGANIVITFWTWMMVEPTLWEEFATEDNVGKSIDMGNMASFVGRVDVYQVMNDESKPGCEFISSIVGGGTIHQDGYLYLKQGETDVVIPVSADWNAVTGLWDVVSYPTDASHLHLWYYAGARMPNLNKSYDYLSDSMALAISQIATARLERAYYANTNATALAENLRQDMAMPPPGRYRAIPKDLLTNPFGTKEGEWRAWRYVRNFAERVMGSAVI